MNFGWECLTSQKVVVGLWRFSGSSNRLLSYACLRKLWRIRASINFEGSIGHGHCNGGYQLADLKGALMSGLGLQLVLISDVHFERPITASDWPVLGPDAIQIQVLIVNADCFRVLNLEFLIFLNLKNQFFFSIFKQAVWYGPITKSCTILPYRSILVDWFILEHSFLKSLFMFLFLFWFLCTHSVLHSVCYTMQCKYAKMRIQRWIYIQIAYYFF